MKKLSYDYYMKIGYSIPVENCHFTIKCFPKNTQRQRVLAQKIGTGRDAGDCLINRGIMHGGGTQTQEIRVSVTEMS